MFDIKSHHRDSIASRLSISFRAGSDKDTQMSISMTVRSLIDACERANHRSSPYDYWLLESILPESLCEAVASLPFEPPDAAIFDGRRETNNSSRIYFNRDNQQRHGPCREMADAFRHPEAIRKLKQLTGRDLALGRLRIEYCQDIDGFWLEPHVDLPVKLFTMLIYLSNDERLADAGTDVYDASPEHRLVTRAPYRWNAGMIFIPATDTWHGFAKRPIRALRKSIIINYVAQDWRATDELA